MSDLTNINQQDVSNPYYLDTQSTDGAGNTAVVGTPKMGGIQDSITASEAISETQGAGSTLQAPVLPNQVASSNPSVPSTDSTSQMAIAGQLVIANADPATLGGTDNTKSALSALQAIATAINALQQEENAEGSDLKTIEQEDQNYINDTNTTSTTANPSATTGTDAGAALSILNGQSDPNASAVAQNTLAQNLSDNVLGSLLQESLNSGPVALALGISFDQLPSDLQNQVSQLNTMLQNMGVVPQNTSNSDFTNNIGQYAEQLAVTAIADDIEGLVGNLSSNVGQTAADQLTPFFENNSTLVDLFNASVKIDSILTGGGGGGGDSKGTDSTTPVDGSSGSGTGAVHGHGGGGGGAGGGDILEQLLEEELLEQLLGEDPTTTLNTLQQTGILPQDSSSISPDMLQNIQQAITNKMTELANQTQLTQADLAATTTNTVDPTDNLVNDQFSNAMQPITSFIQDNITPAIESALQDSNLPQNVNELLANYVETAVFVQLLESSINPPTTNGSSTDLSNQVQQALNNQAQSNLSSQLVSSIVGDGNPSLKQAMTELTNALLLAVDLSVLFSSAQDENGNNISLQDYLNNSNTNNASSLQNISTVSGLTEQDLEHQNVANTMENMQISQAQSEDQQNNLDVIQDMLKMLKKILAELATGGSSGAIASVTDQVSGSTGTDDQQNSLSPPPISA